MSDHNVSGVMDRAKLLETKDAEIERLNAHIEEHQSREGLREMEIERLRNHLKDCKESCGEWADENERLTDENRRLRAVYEAAHMIIRNTGLYDIRGDCCLVKTDWLEALEDALAAAQESDGEC